MTPTANSVVNTNSVSVNGTGYAFATVEVALNGVIRTVSANMFGYWTTTFNNITNGNYTITARQRGGSFDWSAASTRLFTVQV